MSRHRKSFQYLSAAAFTAMMGIIAFSSVAGNPRYETFHVTDIIRLMTAGASVAVTIMMIGLFFNDRERRAKETMEGEIRR